MNTMDLHMHSNYSGDGTYRPARVMELCKEAGMKVVSLTDHDCVRGSQEAAARAKELGITFIPGVELNCRCQGKDLHLLGYGIDSENPQMAELEVQVREKYQNVVWERYRKLLELGIYFDEEEIKEISKKEKVSIHDITGAALKEERNRKHPLMKELFPGGSRSDNPLLNFYWDICASGKPAYVKVNHISFEEAYDLIKEMGGVAVLAHPGQSIGENPELIRYMVDYGLAGIEINCSYHSEEQSRYYEKLGKEFGILKTMGSDFHGTLKPDVHIGQMLGNMYEEDVWKLLQMLDKNA